MPEATSDVKGRPDPAGQSGPDSALPLPKPFFEDRVLFPEKC